MKLFTALAALTLIAAPANAQLNHTGRYYGPNGTYVKCDTIGSYTNNSTYCKSGEDAREDDRRHESKNACLQRVKKEQIAKWGGFDASGVGVPSMFYPIGYLPAEKMSAIGQSEYANDVAYSEYSPKKKQCFAKSGF